MEQELLLENEKLKLQLEEHKDLINAIKNGEVDALAISRNGEPDVFTLESTDFVYRVLVENFAEGAHITRRFKPRAFFKARDRSRVPPARPFAPVETAMAFDPQ